MQFTPTTPFKLWKGEAIFVANYTPGQGYTVREKNDWLRALVQGGPLPGSESATVEMPDLSQTEYRPGDECPGWLNQGLVTLTGLTAGKVSGTAEVAKEG